MTGIKLTQSELAYYAMRVYEGQRDVTEDIYFTEQEWSDEYFDCPEYKNYMELWN